MYRSMELTEPAAMLLALAQNLNAEILGSHSATDTLEKWCHKHHLTDSATVVARVDTSVVKPATAEQRQRLRVSDREEIRHRHVRLFCGDHVLSEADNWYVPARLTDEMNRLLATSDIPFGKAVQAMQPYRRTFATITRWPPLAAAWGYAPSSPEDAGGTVPDALFEHRALLYARDEMPFSEVDEVYRRWLLGFELLQ